MPLLVNIRHLDRHNLELAGELPVADLDIETRDELVNLNQPLQYDLEVQEMEDGLLVRGNLVLPVDCECARCLKAFEYKLELADWACLIPLSGEEAAPRDGDTVDLTPFLREDILLELPQHPLCKPDCGGLSKPTVSDQSKLSDPSDVKTSSAWAELEKLKFRKE
jgi:uncharacterized metal-binding protein YceD (DUF177 family)